MVATHMPTYMRNRRKERREKLVNLFGGKCTVCGTNEALEFDHVDSSSRLFRLSGKGLDGPWQRLLEEAEKCQLLCHAHHREKTVRNREAGGGQNKILNPQHGTEVMYRSCKCPACKKWKRDYRNKLVDSMNRPRIPE